MGKIPTGLHTVTCASKEVKKHTLKNAKPIWGKNSWKLFDDLNYKLPILVMEKINFENMTFDENILDSIIYVSKFHGILLCNNVKFINVDLNVCFLTYDNRNIYNEELGNNFFQKYFFLLRNARINFQNLSFINSNCLGEYLFYMYFYYIDYSEDIINYM